MVQLIKKKNSNNITVKFNEERTLKVLAILIDYYRSGKDARICKKLLPQKVYFPKRIEEGSYEHACWLFFTTFLLRANLNTDDIFRKVKENYASTLFMPRSLESQVTLNDMRIFLKKITGNYNLGKFSENWFKNAVLLNEKYSGDPIYIVEGIEKHPEAIKRLIEFDGWGEKISALFISFLEGAKFIKPMYGNPPLDFHAIRMLIALKLFEIKELDYYNSIRRELFLRKALPLFSEFCYKHKIPTTSLSEAWWLYSRNVCTHQPKGCPGCPIQEYCEYYINYTSYRDDGFITLEPRKKGKQINLLDII